MINGPQSILPSLFAAFLAWQPLAFAQDEEPGSVQTDETEDEEGPALEASSPLLSTPMAAGIGIPSGALGEESPPVPEQISTIPETRSRRKPSTLFGVGIGRPNLIGKYNHYQKIYGKFEKMLSLQMGSYLYTYGIDFGLSAKFGYFNAGGSPLRSLTANDVTLETPLKRDIPENFQTDPNQKVELTLIPVQTLLEVAYSPFPISRRIVLRAYAGPEFLYVQETLKPNIPSTETVPAGTQLVSKGWNRSLVTGAMISISINGIEARSDYALKSIGVDRTYISPYIELVTTTNDKMGNYDRKIYGISLQFEGLR